MKLHVICNSHLDPVWLWDWQEGLNEGITTARTMLDLLDDFPDLIYSRGESAIYQHIQRHDPRTFSRILDMIAAGRWEVIGGAVIQPDTNLPATETLVRQLTHGLSYMQRELGQRPTVAWAADSFGHSAGWPEIYAAAGMTAFACSRPMEQDFPLDKPAFWWEAPTGKRILSWRIPVGWYGTNRDEIQERFDGMLDRAEHWGLENLAVFVGLGNHGGGPSRRNLEDLQRWSAKHSEAGVRFSTLHQFFADLRAENADLPVIRGELNFTLRGCYSSAFHFKKRYRAAENLLLEAERTNAIIGATRNGPAATAGQLHEAWDAVLFNTFHDILPGTSIERAYTDQLAWLGLAFHRAQQTRLAALNALALDIDTRVETPADDMPCAVPMLVWNPQPYAFEGPVELEAGLDYRPIFDYKGRPDELPVEVIGADGEPLPFQRIQIESSFAPETPWRVRVAAWLSLPPLGWQVVSMAWKDNPRLAPAPRENVVETTLKGGLSNGISAVEAREGSGQVDVFFKGARVFGEEGLRVATYADPYGSWGGASSLEHADDNAASAEYWTIRAVHTVYTGPELGQLMVRFAGERSRLDLLVTLHRGNPRVHLAARVHFDEPARRLKLLMPTSGAESAEYEVPGGAVTRQPNGEVPGGRWVRAENFVFASDAIYNFDQHAGRLNATILRASRFACSRDINVDPRPWKPSFDLGEHTFAFSLAPADHDPWQLADELEQPPIVLPTAAHDGLLPRTGSLGELRPASLRLLAFKPAENGPGWVIRVQECTGQSAIGEFRLGESAIALGEIAPSEIKTFRVSGTPKSGWTAERILADEA